MDDYIIVIQEVLRNTNVAQGSSASEKPGYEIWIRESDGWMHFLGYIPLDKLEETVAYYEDIDPGRVEVRRLS